MEKATGVLSCGRDSQPNDDFSSRRDLPSRRDFFILIVSAHHTIGPKLHHAKALALVVELIFHTLG